MPYIVIGAVKVEVILLAARVLFDVATEGSLAMISLGSALFITVTLAIVFPFSTVTQNQLQAMTAQVFILLRAILRAGFV